jgi:hypothetical protein
MVRAAVVALGVVAAGTPLEGQEEHGEFKVVGGGKLPAGWAARVDRDEPLTQTVLEPMDGGWHVRTARSVVLYRPADAARGNYRVTANITQTEDSPGHSEAFGLILGGKDLKGAGIAYTYFLIRADGKVLVKRRAGERTSDVTAGWLDHAAVQQAGDKGACTNELSVVVDAAEVRFLVNGKTIHRARRAEVDADGIAGLRVSHNLDLHLTRFAVTRG